PATRLTMRKIKEILRLKFELKLKNREIARSCQIPHSTVADYLRRARDAGLTWPLVPDLDEEASERRLFADGPWARPSDIRLPDFASVPDELRCHKHVTLQLLWQEYKEAHPDGYQYSRFCELYKRWVRKLDLILRLPTRIPYLGTIFRICDQYWPYVSDAADADTAPNEYVTAIRNTLLSLGCTTGRFGPPEQRQTLEFQKRGVPLTTS